VDFVLVVIIVVALLALAAPLIWLVTKGVGGAAQRATGEIDASGAQGTATDDDTGATGSS
jgi:hypothetical protein